jgi:spore maturation protein CgeB
MRILYYSWEENNKIDMVQALSALGHDVALVTAVTDNALSNSPLEDALFRAAQDVNPAILFSFNYFPFLSRVAERVRVPYVCWVYDCPHWTLFAPEVASSYNYIFLFDQAMVAGTSQNGAAHAFHLPLAVNTGRLSSLLSTKPALMEQYKNTISFVGSLYEHNTYRQISFLPEDLRGYFDGIIASQKQIFGMDLLAELLPQKIVGQFTSYVHLEHDARCPIPDQAFLLSAMQAEVTCEERIAYLEALSHHHPVSLYTTSDASLCPHAAFRGTAAYTTEMPYVFAHSDINLNITLRSITSGIPLRALDIMGCGGFLLSNYQPELDAYFTNGQDYVYFESRADLLQKADYYLAHPKERSEIAANGLARIASDFSYAHQIGQMFDMLDL